MKKIICLLLIVVLFGFLVSCKNDEDKKEKTKEELVNELLDKEYSSVSITRIVGNNERTLQSSYSLVNESNKIILTYEIESFNQLSLDNPDIQEKSIKRGKIEYSNGKKSIIEGEDINIDLNSLSLSSLKFDENDFDKITINDNEVTIEVANAKKYLKSDNDILEFSMIIKYSENEINKVIINYRDQGYSVTIIYDVK